MNCFWIDKKIEVWNFSEKSQKNILFYENWAISLEVDNDYCLTILFYNGDKKIVNLNEFIYFCVFCYYIISDLPYFWYINKVTIYFLCD